MYYLKNTNFWMFGFFFFFYFFIMGAYFPFFPIWLHDVNHISKGREFLPLITSEEQLFRVTDAAIQFFADHANAGERFKFTIDRVGEEKLYEVLKGAYDG